MTSLSRAGLRLVVPALLALATAGTTLAVPSPAAAADGSSARVTLDARRLGTAGRPPATMRVSKQKKAATGQKVQHVTVQWKGTTQGRKTYAKSAVIPGIGQLTMMCRPDATYIRLRAEDRSAETQLWMAKYESKNNHLVVATKTARIYRYADANDDGTGGTGATATEGLNQLGTIENSGSGYMDGVISQRVGRNQAVAGTASTPVTSFKLNWWWAGFRNPPSWRSCKIDAVFTTKFSPRMGVSWHGTDDATGRTVAEYWLPSIGTLVLRCEPDVGSDEGRQTIGLVPIARNKNSTMWVETITGEGLVEDHAEGITYGYDPETGRIGNVDLPRNGMMRIFATVGQKKRAFILSSYVVPNNRAKPQLNVCETAVAAYPWS